MVKRKEYFYNNDLIQSNYDFSIKVINGLDVYKRQGEAKYISAAQVKSAISGDCVISGGFTESEARELAELINSGSLPVKMTEIYSNVVSADYGIGAFNKTATAGIVGVALVMIFMLVVYRFAGVLSLIHILRSSIRSVRCRKAKICRRCPQWRKASASALTYWGSANLRF